MHAESQQAKGERGAGVINKRSSDNEPRRVGRVGSRGWIEEMRPRIRGKGRLRRGGVGGLIAWRKRRDREAASASR